MASTAISCPTTIDCTAVGFGIFGSPVVIGTTDGGTTWTPETVPPGTGPLTAVSCVSTTTCQAVSDFDAGTGSPSIIVTTDGGTVWSPETFPSTVTNFTAISCVDALNCTAVGSSSGGPAAAILNTTNGGSTWTPQSVPDRCAQPRRHLVLERLDRVWPSGSHVVTTTDGGAQWHDHREPGRRRPPSPRSAASVRPPAPPSEAANILDTTNGGTSWTGQAVPTGVGSLVGVSCASPANCEAVGAGTSFGGTIETLSAPPTVTTTQPDHRHHRGAVRELARTRAGAWPPTRGPSPEARCRPGYVSHPTGP